MTDLPNDDPLVPALQLCAWWNRANRMRDQLIDQAHAAGASQYTIAAAMGIHRDTVGRVINQGKDKSDTDGK